MRFRNSAHESYEGEERRSSARCVDDEEMNRHYEEEALEIEKNIRAARTEIATGGNVFFAAISKYPLLTPDEEKELSRRIREERDPEAFERFVLSNVRLALACVRDIQHRMGGNTIMDFMDLSQEAMLGLMTAVERFDHRKGTRFSTYGLYWIYQRVKRAIVSQRKGMSVPGFAGESVFAMADYIEMYNSGNIEEIPARFRNRARDLARISSRMISYGENPERDEEKTGVANLEHIAAENSAGGGGEQARKLGEGLMEQFFASDFHAFLDEELSPYEADVLRRKFGLAPYNIPASNKEIAAVHGKSPETVRINIDALIKRLRKNKRAEKFMKSWLK